MTARTNGANERGSYRTPRSVRSHRANEHPRLLRSFASFAPQICIARSLIRVGDGHVAIDKHENELSFVGLGSDAL
jgi:hypothetical protein